ncbi:MAG TPA: phage integrase N-terminal SAM-like domain-containing protein [Solirubrobacterales bacterium]|nr:phage integrase N-terminal SAM-like domain-containing protein [Solirubrobacterales bacterium]
MNQEDLNTILGLASFLLALGLGPMAVLLSVAFANAGNLRTPSRMTVEQACWLWLEGARTGAVRDRSGHQYKPGTLREYARVLELRVLPEFGHRRLADVTRGELQTFVDELLGRGLAASTIRNTINPLQAIYRHAVRRDLVMVNPTREVDLPAAPGDEGSHRHRG